MAKHASALKRHRQSLKRARRNTALRTRLRHLVRVVRQAVAAGDPTRARDAFAAAARALDKAVTKGVVHRNNASRKVSRLAQALNRLGATGQQ